jgi:DnaJ-class molecular chaperone
MTAIPGPMRCPRCGGSGDIPMIAVDSFVHPERPPALQSCPDCAGTGMLREVEEEAPRRKAR